MIDYLKIARGWQIKKFYSLAEYSDNSTVMYMEFLGQSSYYIAHAWQFFQRLFFSCLDKIDPSIRLRFNPCIFLAEYLMRNNAQHGAKLDYADLFEQ